MTVQINTDKNISINKGFSEQLNDTLKGELGRFSDYITRLEIHLSDEKGKKDVLNDKRCLLEARLAGKQPIAVTETADNYELAVSGAIDKMKHSLETILGRQKNY